MNLNEAFAIKYNTKQQDSDTNAFEALSRDWLGNLAARTAQQGADTAQYNAATNRIGVDKAYDYSKPSSMMTKQAQQPLASSMLSALPRYQPLGTNLQSSLSRLSNGNVILAGQEVDPRKIAGFSHGTARVPGKGSGKEDKVPAVLAPGEAVLNKAAAEKMGRKKIANANKEGAKKMGMVGKSKPGHYAQGTANVPLADKRSFMQKLSDFIVPMPAAKPPQELANQAAVNLGTGTARQAANILQNRRAVIDQQSGY